MSLLPGTQLGSYQIIAPIGAGGMGEVYRAHDRRLGRDVAVKVLPPVLGEDPGRLHRFELEAKALAALNHPNVLAVYDVGSHGGAPFLVMELLDGETLRDQLRRGPLAPQRVLELALELARGLTAAHEKGIVHRDLKPENVFLTRGGQVKILDFGLAKLVPGAGVMPGLDSGETQSLDLEGNHTEAGMLVGTVRYMSPEQACGKPLDGRSDIFSLGVILWELLTGTPPFKGDSVAETLSAILRAEPPGLAPGLVVPPLLERVLRSCLAKDPGNRFHSAHDLVFALQAAQAGVAPEAPVSAGPRKAPRHLRRWAAACLAVLGIALGWWALRPGPGGAITSLAVLPLQNYSGDAQQDFFVDGMTDALIGDLGQIQALKVISRTSVMQYKGGKKTLPEIARELGVQGILEGSVLRSGSRVRVVARLIDARQDRQLWSSNFERDLTDVITLQREVARTVASEIRAALTPQERSRLTAARAVNPEAYDAFLKGIFHWYSLLPADLDASQRYFELALEKDPDYAKAYAGIALVWAGRLQCGYSPPSEAAPKARAAALKAVELDDAIPEAHYALACLRTWIEWDWTGAEPEFKRAIELNPNFPDVRAYYSHYLMHMGRPLEAMPQIKRALELDPLNSLFLTLYSVDLMYAHRYDEAIAQARASLRISPGNPVGLGALWMALQLKGLDGEALPVAKEFYGTIYGAKAVVLALDQAQPEGGYRGAMRKAADALAVHSRKANVNPTDVAGLYAAAGAVDQAIAWFEKGFTGRDSAMPYIGMPVFDRLRTDPRFQDLLTRMGLPNERAK